MARRKLFCRTNQYDCLKDRRHAILSDPVRCKYVDVEPAYRRKRTKSNLLPENKIALRQPTKHSVHPDWQPSAKRTSATGFFDLPIELRNMVYQMVCGQGFRVGLFWHLNRRESQSPRHGFRRKKVHCCAIMRTCRQVHAEFAKTLYATPLSCNVTNRKSRYQTTQRVPIVSTYAPLVMKILLYMGERQKDPKSALTNALQVASSVVDKFCNVQIVKVVWDRSNCGTLDYEIEKGTPSNWIHDVRSGKDLIREVRDQYGESMAIPYQLVLVEAHHDFLNANSPFCKAVRNLRSQPLKEA
ncbi:hypothetical protein BDV95DRAFT_594382 [Massariosphaeria phaeospora]|uniref:Uncharacterized protein n=1 Tax=Massariosphaeria phaeospora TaxID=100035 RepID=A0A7C8M8Q5_9PLEO|nr:hypothetical protein BDV95DRAFT_594382 [Massariosphaeria phaeospora]